MPGRVQNLVVADMKRRTNLLLLRRNERRHDQKKHNEMEKRLPGNLRRNPRGLLLKAGAM